MTGHHSFVAAFVMWQVMTLAMMAPVAWRWIALFAALSDGGGVTFAAGYAAAWLPFSAAAAALQHALQHSRWMSADAALTGVLPAIVLMSAGAFQFAPIRRACLRHCRNPLTYFLVRWRNGPPNGFRIGAAHGAYCVGCCWALMATAFAVGAMNAGWMLWLALLGAVEQLAPGGERIGRLAGAGLAGYGLVLLLR